MKKVLNIFLSIIILVLIIYAFSPVYDFPEATKFLGDKIFNPYKDMDSTQWKKANFHIHARTLLGILNGRKNSPEKIHETYRFLGYDVLSISNYFNIDNYNKSLSTSNEQRTTNYIPSYEHGANSFKVHHLNVGANKVLFFDYPFFQSVNQKQHIISLLKKRSDLVALAHPSWQNAYKPSDLKKLGGYDCFEVLNHNKFSVPLWDSTLSSGHAAYIIADDDAHDIYNTHQVGRCCTFVNSSLLSRQSIISSIKSGKAFGVDFNFAEDEPFAKKAIAIRSLPMVNNISVINSIVSKNEQLSTNNKATLLIRLSQPAKTIDFIGQNGKLKKSVSNVITATYEIQPDDSYIRTEILFPSGAKYYLNPVFRYNSDSSVYNKLPVVNIIKTIIYRSIIILIILLLLVIMFYNPIKSKYKVKSL